MRDINEIYDHFVNNYGPTSPAEDRLLDMILDLMEEVDRLKNHYHKLDAAPGTMSLPVTQYKEIDE